MLKFVLQVAQSKTRQFVQQSIKLKLRRPSTPEDLRKNKATPSSNERANSAEYKGRYVGYLHEGTSHGKAYRLNGSCCNSP